MEKACSGSAARKRLADICNLSLPPKPLTKDEKPRSNSATIKDFIVQLRKENAALVKLLADRNKIIEASGVELQKLMVNLQRMQQQNLQLAQELNSGKDKVSFLTDESNSGKDKRKMLQHELGCKTGLLIAKKLESEGKGNPRRFQKDEIKVEVTKFENGLCSLGDRGSDKPCTTRRQQTKSLGPSSAHDMEKIEKKRLVARRQSARFRQEEPNSIENLEEIDHVKKLPEDSFADVQMQENILNPVSLTIKIEDKEDYVTLDGQIEVTRRSSIARPSRHAAMKVGSYKEQLLTTKMLRTV